MSPLAVFLSLIPVMASQGGQLCSHQDLLDPNTCRYEYKLTLLFSYENQQLKFLVFIFLIKQYILNFFFK